MAIRLGIGGIGGRMGREVAAAASADPRFVLVGGIERAEAIEAASAALSPALRVVSSGEALLGDLDALVDFSTPEGTVARARECARAGVPFVSGVTGLSDEQRAALVVSAASVPVFYARNMSVGINALAAALPAIVRALDGYDVEIVEMHHRHKADAPSGTALVLAEAITNALGANLGEEAVHGRKGVAPRRAGEIGIHAVRAGGNAGEHVVIVADEGEEIRIGHRAYSRKTFALGALRAAAFVVGRAPAFYGMSELIGS